MKRCGQCPNCLFVQLVKTHYMPNPPFRRATADSVADWNAIVTASPCTAPIEIVPLS